MASSYYELLEIAPTAPTEEIKRAFRQQIALYHPDKVQHLGKEFQAMAAERAAALTEAYRILSNEERRAEYDRARSAGAAAAPAPAAAAAAEPQGVAPAADAPQDQQHSAQFKQERAHRDAFVRKATVGRFRQAIDATIADYDHTQVAGFDIACAPKSKLFARAKGPRLLVRFVSAVDGRAVADAWSRASQWAGRDETCVFLMGSSVAPAGELSSAIAEERRKNARHSNVTLIPIDARDWQAHMPVDAPGIAKTLLAKVRSG